jgi:AraC-like DNA-binding protein
MIGKTRQQSAPLIRTSEVASATEVRASDVEEVYDPEVGQARGMLRRPLRAGKMRHARKRPAADLAEWIAHYWMIRWDLRGCEPQLAESVPHPNVHVIFEPAASVVAGVQTHMFKRTLEGQSQVFGVKFKPGGFRPFLGYAVSKLANRTVPVARIFGKDVQALQSIVLSDGSENEKVEAANAFFHQRMPEPDTTVALAAQLVEQILQDREIKTVDDLVERTSIGKRSLQRLFSEYVGVSPKWVIRRYRLHELIERFRPGGEPDWPQLALELGYFDQAHLINDFRSITGYSPTEYQKLIQRGM